MKFLFDSFANAFLYGVGYGVFFGLFGILFLIIDGEPTGILALGSFGFIFGMLMGFGQTIIDRIGRAVEPHLNLFQTVTLLMTRIKSGV